MARFKIETARGVVLCFTSPPPGRKGGGGERLSRLGGKNYKCVKKRGGGKE